MRYLDLAKNRIETLDTDISGCEALEDLLLSSNMLQHLPDSIGTRKRGAWRILQLIVWTVDGRERQRVCVIPGMLKKLTTLKVDDNQLTSLPNTIGR